MTYRITTPSGVSITVTADPNDRYLQDIQSRGYRVIAIHQRPVLEACESCQG